MDIPLMESHVEPTAVFVVLRVRPPQQTLRRSRIQYFVSIYIMRDAYWLYYRYSSSLLPQTLSSHWSAYNWFFVFEVRSTAQVTDQGETLASHHKRRRQQQQNRNQFFFIKKKKKKKKKISTHTKDGEKKKKKKRIKSFYWDLSRDCFVYIISIIMSSNEIYCLWFYIKKRCPDT